MPVPVLSLRTGAELPAIGLGLWKIPPAEAPGVVVEAARAGYRHFDSASDYGNENAVGAGLKAAMAEGACSRDDLWVTSKLWNTNHEPQHVRPAAERTLRDLQLDYLDLYLIHFPISLRHVPVQTRYPAGWFFDPAAPQPKMELIRAPISETWLAMEGLVEVGLVRNIGVCNFNTSLLRDLAAHAAIQPAVLQVELHPLLTQERLLRYCQEEGIAVTAFSPLGSPSYVPIGMARAEESVLEHSVVTRAGQAHGKSPAQVVLRWGVQRGTAVVPKSVRPGRLRENLDIFDFELSDQEMLDVSALNANRRFNDPGVFCEAAFHTFCPIYE